MAHRETFEQLDFSHQRPFDDEVYECRFEGCDLTESDLSGLTLVDCEFVGTNLSMVDLTNGRLQGVSFENCKLVGVDFSVASDFALAVEFDECVVDFASFWGLKMPQTTFADCRLREGDFSESELTEASFDGCDLTEAVFVGSDLREADFRGARHFSIDPDQNRISDATFSRSTLAGLLDAYDIVIEP